MKANFLAVIGVLSMLVLGGCATVHSPVGAGSIFTNVKGPVTATHLAAGADGVKTGHATAMNVLGLIAIGDASVHAAKVDGAVDEIISVDHESFSVLGLYSRYTTIVRGK